jgi:hypothetical protein
MKNPIEKHTNTRRFLKFGQGGDTYSIHRAVWGPGVKTRRHAFQYVNQLLLEQAESAGADVILDLGCGAGGSIRYLADRISSRLYGVTISAVQAGIGKKVLQDAGINDRCSVYHGDFLEPEFYRNVGIYNNTDHTGCCEAFSGSDSIAWERLAGRFKRGKCTAAMPKTPHHWILFHLIHSRIAMRCL